MNNRSEQEQVRIEKLEKIREQGQAYPNTFKPKQTAADLLVLGAPAKTEDEDTAGLPRYSIAGRIVARRMMGKAAFIKILDRSGQVQAYVRRDDIGVEEYQGFKTFDVGDIVYLKGFLFETRTGELTLHADQISLVTKGLIPLPEKWHGLGDVDARYRYRYVDLISNPDVRATFKTRAKVIQAIRNYLNERDYLEAETPILSDVASGAIARPFTSHFNALSADMFLRIATELPLKKLVVGGIERVYEIGKIFRNEGLSRKHNPEFTSIEFYQAYADFSDLMTLTEDLLKQLAESVHGSTDFSYAEKTISFAGTWQRISMQDSIYEIGGVDRAMASDSIEDLTAIAEKHQVKLTTKDWGEALDTLWGDLVEPKISDPVFITHHPASISPFARRNDQDPRITDRFELIIAGMEIANGFSELNDPFDQAQRFADQTEKKETGEHEVAGADADFIRALEYGMPPTAGEGIGIDRLVMLLTDSQTIREVVFFPQLKPLSGEELQAEALDAQSKA